MLRHRSNYDYAIVNSVRGQGNVLREELRRLDLFSVGSQDKFIPLDYLINGSVQQRLSLLQGLMDTDGCVQKSGSLSFATCSPKLAEDVQYLVRSLGGIACIRRG